MPMPGVSVASSVPAKIVKFRTIVQKSHRKGKCAEKLRHASTPLRKNDLPKSG